MNDQWYYGRGSDITGPVTGAELTALAADGTIDPTDTVWKEGVESGVPARKVRHLFVPSPAADPVPVAVVPEPPPVAAAPPAAVVEVAPAEGDILNVPADVGLIGEDEFEAPAAAPVAPPPEKKKARATAGKGTSIVGQDGKNVKFRMKCSVCKHEDSSFKTMPITRGTTRVSFFCPKCKKKRDGEINGYV